MCGRFTLRRLDLQAVRRELRAETGASDILSEPRYNVAPTDQVPILVRLESGTRDLTPMVWGSPRSRSDRMVRQINSRGETIPAQS
jgi:putative SOS response-associated peptidase YedK